MQHSPGFEERQVLTRLGTMSYRERADVGAPFVLLHGVGGNSGAWRRQAGAFGGLRLIAWDAPGYGGSFDFDTPSPSLDDYAAAVASLLDALEIERAIVLGHSFGGLVAAAFAARHAGRVSRLLLTACSSGHATYPAAQRESLLAARLAGFDGTDAVGYSRSRVARLLSDDAPPEVIEEAVSVMSRIRLPGFHQANRMISSADIYPYLPSITAPSCVICGTADQVTPLASNSRIAASLPSASLVPIEGAGHWLFLEHADDFNAAVTAFVLEPLANESFQEQTHGGRYHA